MFRQGVHSPSLLCLSELTACLSLRGGFSSSYLCPRGCINSLSLSPWSYIIFALPSVRLILWCSLSFPLNLYAANPPSLPIQPQDISTVFVTTPCWPPPWFLTSCHECWWQLAKLGTEWWRPTWEWQRVPCMPTWDLLHNRFGLWLNSPFVITGRE